MKLITKSFNDIRELADYVNDLGIKKEQIVDILRPDRDTVTLVYYGE